MVDVRATFEPDPSQAKVYDTLYPEFVNLYKQHQADPQASEPPLSEEYTMEPSDLDFVVDVLETELRPYRDSHHTYRQLPATGRPRAEILGEMRELADARGAEVARRIRLRCGVSRRI